MKMTMEMIITMTKEKTGRRKERKEDTKIGNDNDQGKGGEKDRKKVWVC